VNTEELRRRAIVQAKMEEDDRRAAEAKLHPPVRERHMTKAEKATLKPGRFWARSSAGVMLNQRFVIGWRGVNPGRP